MVHVCLSSSPNTFWPLHLHLSLFLSAEVLITMFTWFYMSWSYMFWVNWWFARNIHIYIWMFKVHFCSHEFVIHFLSTGNITCATFNFWPCVNGRKWNVAHVVLPVLSHTPNIGSCICIYFLFLSAGCSLPTMFTWCFTAHKRFARRTIYVGRTVDIPIYG